MKAFHRKSLVMMIFGYQKLMRIIWYWLLVGDMIPPNKFARKVANEGMMLIAFRVYRLAMMTSVVYACAIYIPSI